MYICIYIYINVGCKQTAASGNDVSKLPGGEEQQQPLKGAEPTLWQKKNVEIVEKEFQKDLEVQS